MINMIYHLKSMFLSTTLTSRRGVGVGVLACLLALTMTSCDDFFETDPDNILKDDDYIRKESEMYRGFLGIITSMQEVGDNAIYLTDTRCQFLETTGNAPVALQNINNYAPTDGNEYADPTGYYNVIAACNDFVAKMDEFYTDINGALSDSAKVHIPRLISCATRIKVWAYIQLGKIYGEAYWYDARMTELTSLSDAAFTHYSAANGTLAGLWDKCIQTLDQGIQTCGQQIPADLTMDWTTWVDPVNGNANYDFWKYMTPPWMLLRAEATSWRASECASETEARPYYQWLHDNLLTYIDQQPVKVDLQTNTTYILHAQALTVVSILYYSELFYTEQVNQYADWQLLGAIFYDYQNKQRNRLVQYLCPEYPGDGYYLRPSEYGQSIYSEADLRGPTQKLMTYTLSGEPAFTKYYYTRREYKGYLRDKIFEIEPSIPLYRAQDLHFLLAEAENHLGHWDVARTILNNGIEGRFPGGKDTMSKDTLDGKPVWADEYVRWFPYDISYIDAAGTTRTGSPSGNIGIVGVTRGEEYDLTTYEDYLAANPEATPEDFAYDAERIREYDMALADEYIKEFTGEGKAYPYLVKMAERYGKDYNVIYDRVKGKYDASQAATVRSSLQEKYFIDWNLRIE